MGRVIIYILIMIFAANTSFAAELELSDIIKDARKSEKLKLSEAKKEAVQPVKNETPSLKGEQSACEKLNPKEIMRQQTANNLPD